MEDNEIKKPLLTSTSDQRATRKDFLRHLEMTQYELNIALNDAAKLLPGDDAQFEQLEQMYRELNEILYQWRIETTREDRK